MPVPVYKEIKIYQVSGKVKIFWEGHKTWKKNSKNIWQQFEKLSQLAKYVTSKPLGDFFKKKLPFPEYLNFTKEESQLQ